MPTHSLSKMSEQDMRNLYRYVHSLGGAGEPEPENLPPGVLPTTAYEDMIPGPPAGAGSRGSPPAAR